MKTRRSRKSFEVVPPRRRNRKSVNKRRALNVFNETIVLSDSDHEEDAVQLTDDDDIQVIDVADASDTVINVPEEPVASYSRRTPEAASCSLRTPEVASCGRKTPEVALCNRKTPEVALCGRKTPEVALCGRKTPEVTLVSRRTPEIALKVEEVNCDPPVINLGDDTEDLNEDDDGVEVVAVVVSSGSHSSRSQKRSSLKRKSSNGNHLIQMQESIKKAKNSLRRSSSISSRTSEVLQNPLNKISTNSRQIKRNNNKWARANKKFQMNNNRNFQQGRKRNAMLHNRTREYDRQVIFRPGNEEYKNPFCLNNFSFELNPFLPTNASTPALNRNTAERVTWMPSRRQGPSSIAPGSNIMNAGQTIQRAKGTLRPIVIDGSNIAVGHGGMLQGVGPGPKFSARGIKICVEYFKKRGHQEIVAFVPRYRLKKSECLDPELLEEMERQGHVRFTPSREAGGMRIASYDDLFVVEYAHETGGIIISNDNFKDLYDKKKHLQETITFRLLQYTWITQDVVMFPEDPLGRNGPSLDDFLRFQ